MNLRLARRTSKVLNIVLGVVGTSHDHNVMSLVGLHVPTMSNKVGCLFDVDIIRLQHTRNVALASSEAFHQRTNLGMVSVVEMLCKLLWQSLLATSSEVAQVHGQNAEGVLGRVYRRAICHSVSVALVVCILVFKDKIPPPLQP